MYDDFADSFAVHAEHSAYNAHYDRPAVLGRLGDVAGRTVLDVGCGSGWYAAGLVERGAQVLGFDGSAKLAQHARRRLGDRVVGWEQLGGSYFTDETVGDTWNAGWRVRFRRAPLTTWRAEFAETGFRIERLVEPRPAPSMKERFPDTYAKLSARPFFIAFVLAPQAT